MARNANGSMSSGMEAFASKLAKTTDLKTLIEAQKRITTRIQALSGVALPTYQDDPTSSYQPHCPKAWHKKVVGQVTCRGCGQVFVKYCNGLYEKNFYVHCIKECPKYRDLNLVTECHECRHLFLNKKSFVHHSCQRAKKLKLQQAAAAVQVVQ